MKFGLFEDKNSDRESSLRIVEGSTFWADKDGDLYCVNEITRQCWSVKASDALETVLRRESLKSVVCCHQDGGGLKSNAGHTENYLKRFY